METMNKEKANRILSNIISYVSADINFPVWDIKNVLTCRYLAQNTAAETATKTGLTVKTVIEILQAVQQVTKGKSLIDFA